MLSMRFFFFFVLLSACSPPPPEPEEPTEDQYVQITRDEVNLRTLPDGTVIGQANVGDIFKFVAPWDDWSVIEMFSGEQRFVHSDLVTPSQRPEFPSEAMRKRAFLAVIDLYRRVEDEAYAQVCPDPTVILCPRTEEEIKLVINFERFFEDRYKLREFQALGISPVFYWEIYKEGLRKRW